MSRIARTLVSSILTLAATAFATASSAAVFSVNQASPAPCGSCTSACCSVVDAVNAAQANGAGLDSIVLQSGATYTFNAKYGPSAALPNITTQIRIIGNGATLERAATASAFRLMHVAAPGILTASRITLRGGSEAAGGALYSAYGKVRLDQSVIEDNTAGSYGGGIYASGGELTLTKCSVRDNVSNAHGGGIMMRRDATTQSFGAFSATNSAIVNNTSAATGGGLVLTTVTSAHFTNTTISGNDSGNFGGGVWISYTDNSASITFTNVTISDNYAPQRGAGIMVSGCSVPKPVQPRLVNTILAANPSDNLYAYGECEGTFVSAGNNLFDNGATTVMGCVMTVQATDIVSNVNLGLYPLSTATAPGKENHQLYVNSLAIDHGQNASCSNYDQIGAMRYTTACEIGAVEFIPKNPVVCPYFNYGDPMTVPQTLSY